MSSDSDEEVMQTEESKKFLPARPNWDTIQHRLLARHYANSALATEEARRLKGTRKGQSSKRGANESATAAEAAAMAHELPGGFRTLQAPTQEFLDLGREYAAPDSTPAQQLDLAILLEEYALQLLDDMPQAAPIPARNQTIAHCETKKRSKRHHQLAQSLDVSSKETSMFSAAEQVRGQEK